MRITSFIAALSLLSAAAPALAQAEQETEQQQAESDEEDRNGGIPWQAEIYSNFTGWTQEELKTRQPWDLAHKCGGSLIAEGWVLTAAHCINQERIDKGYRVRLGAAYLDRGEGVTYLIDRMVVHADYDPKTKRNDIAMIHYVADDKTDENAEKVDIRAIPMYDGPPLGPGLPVTASGWGQLEEGANKGYQNEITIVELKIVDCARYPDYAGKVDANVMCAGAPDQDTCRGDSGGPLYVGEGENAVLVGVVSWGKGCYRENSAGVYTRIDRVNFRDWVARAMASDPSISELR